MIDVELKAAFQVQGCPICHLRRTGESRYLFHTLWECITDATFRQRFLDSEGLCPEHAWKLLEMEERQWHDGMGTGILYESLLAAVRRSLKQQAAAIQRDDLPWWHPGRWLKHKPPPALPSSEPCPVCHIVTRNEQLYTQALSTRLQEPGWREAYQQSDGLCLPHLRMTLEGTTPEVADRLLVETERRLAELHQDLSEYLRKHSWQHRQEPLSEREKNSWRRAVAVLRGERRSLRLWRSPREDEEGGK